VFTVDALLVGAVAAFIVGLSKTGLPGGALIAAPLFATLVDGRLIPGASLPVLLVADVCAVTLYHDHARWDLLRSLAIGVVVGFAGGVVFFIAVGSATRPIEVTIGGIILVVVILQAWRLWRQTAVKRATPLTAAGYGTAGGFTTFVANAAGPIMNSYMAGLGLSKNELVGTSALFYCAVNLAKVPIYLAIGEWTDGGPFFTGETLAFDAAMIPAILIGVASGRALFHVISQRMFLVVVLGLSAAGALRILLP
jgi:uncharacterized membrane protein YfcA